MSEGDEDEGVWAGGDDEDEGVGGWAVPLEE